MSNIRKIVLDVLKPHMLDLVQYSDKLSSTRDIKGVSIIMNEVDQGTESVKVIVEGQRLNYQSIRKDIERPSGSIPSLDAIYAGDAIVDDVDTLQDR